MNALQRLVPLVVAAVLALTNGLASATVTISGTRVIYPSDARDVSVRLSNIGKEPGLVQAWIDDGDIAKKPEELDVPFSVTPSIVRMDGGRNQVLRVVFDGADLPKDRESVYWLNVLEIPPRPDGKTVTNYLQFAIRTRIKLFYRPTALKGADKAATQLTWSSPADAGKDEWAVRIENPTPFHVSLAEVKPQLPDGKLDVLNGMVPPFGHLTLRFKVRPDERARIKKVMFRWVDDYGAYVDGEAEPR